MEYSSRGRFIDLDTCLLLISILAYRISSLLVLSSFPKFPSSFSSTPLSAPESAEVLIFDQKHVLSKHISRFNLENRFRFNSIPSTIPDCASLPSLSFSLPPPLSHRKSTLNSVFVGVERSVVREQ